MPEIQLILRKMKKYFRFKLLLFFILFSGLSFAQDCYHYHSAKCKFQTDERFKYSGQSRSGKFMKGQTSGFSIVVYAERDYSFTICYPKRLKNVEFKITEEGEDQRVLYNNSSDDFATVKVLSFETTKKLRIDITVQGEEKEKEKAHMKAYCVGVLIEYMRTPSDGF